MDEERAILPPVYSTDVFVCSDQVRLDLSVIHLTPLMRDPIRRVLGEHDPAGKLPPMNSVSCTRYSSVREQQSINTMSIHLLLKERSSLVLSASAFLYNHILMIFNNKFISIVIEQTQRFQ
jgi:hypothetical protein